MYLDSHIVKRLRKENKLSQHYMAEILQISQSQYSRIENGESKLDSEKMVLIANKFNISDWNLLKLSENKNSNQDNLSSDERSFHLLEIAELKKMNEILENENILLKKMLKLL